MDQVTISFTAIYLRIDGGYVGFVEELPGLHSQGHTLGETRALLQEIVAVVFDEERQSAEAMIEGKDVLREEFLLDLGPASRGDAEAEA